MTLKQNRPRCWHQREAAGDEMATRRVRLSDSYLTPPFSVSQQFKVWVAQARRAGHHRLARYLTAYLILRDSE